MPKKPDPEMQAFRADLLEAVRDMKARRAARATQVQVTDAAGARGSACRSPNSPRCWAYRCARSRTGNRTTASPRARRRP